MVPARPPASPHGFVDSAAVSKASRRERQRQNREARREYEAKLAKRRQAFRTGRRVAFIAVPGLIVLAIIELTSGGGSSSAGAVSCQTVKTPPPKSVQLSAPPQGLTPGASYNAAIQTSCGTINVSLDAAQYPKSVNNFVALANQGFYNNMAFVRAAKDFVVQAGSPDQTNKTTSNGPGYSVQAETPTTAPGGEPYPQGTVAFAKNGSDPSGTANSQFFIVTGSGQGLTPDYAIIGRVSTKQGLKVAQKIGSFAPKSGDGTLTTPVVIKKVTITPGSATTPTS
jgi:peptidyl-prolyl cis-trans isomerase B (cyclophilin B)